MARPQAENAKNSSPGAPLLRQIPNKGLLSHATAVLLLALFGISLSPGFTSDITSLSPFFSF